MVHSMMIVSGHLHYGTGCDASIRMVQGMMLVSGYLHYVTRCDVNAMALTLDLGLITASSLWCVSVYQALNFMMNMTISTNIWPWSQA
jgi:hypothetical protein